MSSLNENHVITLAEAAQMTKTYRLIFGTTFLGGSISKQAILNLLAQDGAKDLRIYMARKADLAPNFVLCAVDTNGNDILTMVLDRTNVCPPQCGNANVLNSSVL